MKIRINEDIVYKCVCEKCGYITRIWAVQKIVNGELFTYPSDIVCSNCMSIMKSELVEDLTNINME